MNAEPIPDSWRFIEEYLTEAACADDQGAERAAIARGMLAAERLRETHPDHYQSYHALGLLWYHHPDKTPERSSKVKELLRQALKLNPASQFSIQYLAYIHFDERDYRTALSYYELTDKEFFKEHDQLWRWLKAWETSIACRTYLDPASLTLDAVRAFMSAHRQAVPKGEHAKFQWELWYCLRDLAPEYRARHAAIIAEVREFIVESGNGCILGAESEADS